MSLVISDLKKKAILFIEPTGYEYNIEREDVIRIDFVLKKEEDTFKIDIALESNKGDEDLLTIWDNNLNLKVFINDELEYFPEFF